MCLEDDFASLNLLELKCGDIADCHSCVLEVKRINSRRQIFGAADFYSSTTRMGDFPFGQSNVLT